MGNAQRGLISGFSGTDDGEDNPLAASNGWSDPGWQIHDEYFFQPPKVLSASENGFPAQDMFVYVPKQ